MKVLLFYKRIHSYSSNKKYTARCFFESSCYTNKTC